MIYESIYVENGYANRQEYLEGLAEEHAVPLHLVEALADLLGPEEDFDGLATGIEDLAYERSMENGGEF